MADTATSGDRISELAEEFLARYRQGSRPTVEGYAAAHPDLADEIRRLFPALLLMEDLKPASGEATGSFDPAAVVVRGATLERLGGFRVLREVGRGGMGVVYEAEQESLGRRVALKVLATHALKDPAQVRRFEREARAAARLHHTNIVPVFGVGEQEGLHYYVMQFIPGLGLDEVIAEVKHLRAATPAPATPAEPPADLDVAPTAAGIARSMVTEHFAPARPPSEATGAMPPDGEAGPGPARAATPEPSPGRALETSALSSISGGDLRYFRSIARVGLQVARALEYAHTQGIFHRDVKPSNLLLDVQGTAWVADFGLAKAVEGDDLTHTGDIVGTIRYMAPERFQGRCDARSDVYALGLTLYEMLALRPAFDKADRQALVRQVMEEEPPRLRALCPLVPRDLETVVNKAIARDPAGRYPTADALAEDLALYLDGKPVRARRVAVPERVWKWSKRRPAVAALLAGLAATVLTGLAAVTWQWRAAVAARDEARQALQMANEAVDTYFTQVSEEHLLNEPGMQPLREKLLKLSLPYYRRLAEQGSHDPGLRVALANAYLRWGLIASEIGTGEEAESRLATAAGLFRRLIGAEPANIEARAGLARAHQALAQQRIFTRQLESGRRDAEQAITAWQAVLTANPEDLRSRVMLGRTYDLLGVSWGMAGEIPRALPFFEKAVGALSSAVDRAPSDFEARRRLGVAAGNLATGRRHEGRLTEAAASARRAADLLRALCTEDPSSLSLQADLARTLAGLGQTCQELGAFRDAEAALTEARRISRRLVDDNPQVSSYRYILGEACLYLGSMSTAQGKTTSAGRVLNEGRESRAELVRHNPRYQDTAITSSEYETALAALDGELGRWGSARKSIDEAIRLQLKVLHLDDPGQRIYSTSLMETLGLCALLEVKAGRPMSPGELATLRRLIDDRCQPVRESSRDLRAPCEAVAGLLALAEQSWASGTPDKALVTLGRVSDVLGPALRTFPDQPRLLALSARAEMTRGAILQQAGRGTEALLAADQAVATAERLARDEPSYLYDMACARAFRSTLGPAAPEHLAAAIQALRGAVDAGFENAYKLEHDDRLSSLRSRDDFRALMRRVGSNAGQSGEAGMRPEP